MRLVIHAGLHKTASTYLQAVLLKNQEALLARGIYYQPEAGAGANHSTAWAARLGDYIGIREHLKLATMTRKSQIILSSEDFESLIFTPAFARGLEDAARASGVTEIEWHFCLRDPGEYFLSQYAQLAKHVYVDFAVMFEAAAREGRFDVESELHRHPDRWSHCFDYESHLSTLAEAITGTLVFHDFRDRFPFPGHAIIERLTGGNLPLALPPDSVKNPRIPKGDVEALNWDRLEKVADRTEVGSTTRDFLRGRVSVPDGVLTESGAAISRLYASGMERLLEMKPMQGRGR